MSNKRYVLVTGGAGYIGSHTCVVLHEAGYTPVIADDFRNSSENIINGITNLIGSKPILHEVDVCDPAEMRTLFEKYDFLGVIHFAAYKAVGESVEEPLMYYRNNLDSLLTLLELSSEFELNRIVFSSSCTVYGTPKSPVVDEKSDVIEASSPYGATKQMSERILSDYHASKKNCGIINLRYFNPVGAHPSGEIGELPLGRPNNLFPFVTQTAAGVRESLTVFGNDYTTEDGTCLRDYIHVVDLAEAHVQALKYLESHPKTYEIFNLGTGEATSVLEIIHTFEEQTGVKLNWTFGERRPGDVEQIYADPAKAEKELGWVAQRSVKDAIIDAWNWEKKIRNV